MKRMAIVYLTVSQEENTEVGEKKNKDIVTKISVSYGTTEFVYRGDWTALRVDKAEKENKRQLSEQWESTNWPADGHQADGGLPLVQQWHQEHDENILQNVKKKKKKQKRMPTPTQIYQTEMLTIAHSPHCFLWTKINYLPVMKNNNKFPSLKERAKNKGTWSCFINPRKAVPR